MASLPVFDHEEQERVPHVGIPDHPGGESCNCVAAFGRTMIHCPLWSWWSESFRPRPGLWDSERPQHLTQADRGLRSDAGPGAAARSISCNTIPCNTNPCNTNPCN